MNKTDGHDVTVRVLLAELNNDRPIREDISRHLQSAGYSVDIGTRASEVMKLLGRFGGHYYDIIIIVETERLFASAKKLLSAIKERYHDIEVVFIGKTAGTSSLLLQAEVFKYLKQPISSEELILTVQRASQATQARRDLTALSKLREASRAINAARGINEIFYLTCKAAVELTGASHSGLLKFKSDLSEGTLAAQYPEFEKRLGAEAVFPVADVLAERRLVYEGQVLNIADVENEESLGPVRNLLRHRGIRSILIVPVMVEGEVVVSFSLDAIEEPRVFSKREELLCTLLAEYVALALENPRLPETLKETRDAPPVNGANGGSSGVWQRVAHNVKEALDCDLVTLYQYYESQGIFGYPPIMEGKFNYPERVKRESSIPEESFVREVFNLEGVLAIPDTTTDKRTSWRRFREEEDVKSLLATPLIILGKRVGVIFANFRRQINFENKDVEMFRTQTALAVQLALELEETTRLLEGSEKGDKVIATIRQLTARQLTVGKELNALFHAAIKALSDELSIPIEGTVALWDEISNGLAITYSTMPERKGSIGYEAVGMSNLDKVAHTKEHLNISDLSLEKEPGGVKGRGSELSVPLTYGEGEERNTIGVFEIWNPQPHAFGSTEVKLAQRVSTELVSAIRYMQVLEASRAISSTRTLDETLQSIADQAVRLVGANRGNAEEGVFSYVSFVENDVIHFVAASPAEELEALPREFREIDLRSPGKKGVVSRAVRRRSFERVNDVRLDPDYLRFRRDTGAQVTVPLMDEEGEVFAAISVEQVQNAFSMEDVRNLELLASFASIVIRNIRELELSITLAQMGMITSAMRHSIVGGTSGIQQAAHLLINNIKKLDIAFWAREPLIRQLEGIRKSAEQMLELSRESEHGLGVSEVFDRQSNKADIPSLALDTTTQELQPIYLHSFLRDVLGKLLQAESQKDIDYRLDFGNRSEPLEEGDLVNLYVGNQSEPLVEGDPVGLRYIIEILTKNAIHAMKDSETRQLTISTRRSIDTGIEIRISDTGPGIPGIIAHKLFKEIVSTKDGPNTNGHGRGLLIAQGLARSMGGWIQIDSTGPNGTTMVLGLREKITY